MPAGPKQRSMLQDPDGDKVMIGEIQVNEVVEHPWSEISATDIDDGKQREYAGGTSRAPVIMRFHEHAWSTKFWSCQQRCHQNTLVFLKEQGGTVISRLVMKHFNTWEEESNAFFAGSPTPDSFHLVLALAPKRVALGKSQTIACLDVSAACLHADMRDEVNIKMDADTHPEFATMTKPCMDRFTTILERHCRGGREKRLDSNPATSTILSVHGPWILSSVRAR